MRIALLFTVILASGILVPSLSGCTSRHQKQTDVYLRESGEKLPDAR